MEKTKQKSGIPEFLKITLTGAILGCLFSIHLYELIQYYKGASTHIPIRWCLYVCFLSSFHLLEFCVVAMYHPETLSYDSFLVNHSTAYTIAITSSVIEFWLEYLIYPQGKDFSTIAKYGALLTLAGELTRFIGECTLKQNFTHIIRVQKASNQQLIKTGIYKYLRHPAYTGWFYFVIGTQIVLGNFVCFILYCFAAWYFFADRIPYPLLLSLILSFHHSCTYEEDLLEQFFPGEYEEYKKTTHIFIPYIYALTNKYFLISEVIALRNM